MHTIKPEYVFKKHEEEKNNNKLTIKANKFGRNTRNITHFFIESKTLFAEQKVRN